MGKKSSARERLYLSPTQEVSPVPTTKSIPKYRIYIHGNCKVVERFVDYRGAVAMPCLYWWCDFPNPFTSVQSLRWPCANFSSKATRDPNIYQRGLILAIIEETFIAVYTFDAQSRDTI